MKPVSDLDFIQAYLDGELPPAQTVAFENRLRAEPRLADLLVKIAREEAILTEWAGAHAAAAGARPGVRRRVEPARRPSRWIAAALVVGSLAAGIIAVVWSGVLGTVPSLATNGQQYAANTTNPATNAEAPAFAKLDDIQGDVFVVSDTGEVAAKPGQELRQGETLRTRGEGSSAVVSFADAGRLEIGNDTTVRLELTGPPAPSTDAKSLVTKVILTEGTIAADAGKQPSDRPMVVATPHAEARMKDSRANFTSVARGTRIEQERGQLQLTRKSDGRSIDVPTGWFALAPANATTEQFAPQPMPQTVNQARLVLKENSKEGLGPVHALAYLPDGGVLAAGCGDSALKFFNMTANGLTMGGFKTGTSKPPVRGVAFAHDGRLLAAASDERNIKVYHGSTHRELGVLKGHKQPITAIAFARAGALLATASGGQRNGEIKLWNAETRQELPGPPAVTGAVLAVAFSPDSRLLAAGFRDGLVKVWDLAARDLKFTLAGHTGPVNAVAFAPDGNALASAGKDLTIKFWDTATGSERRSFAGLASEVRSIAFSPDGRLFAAADHSVHLWDLATGQQLRTLKGQKGNINAVVFAPNGKQIATGGADRTIRVWDVPSP